jgi:hypothetical protein
VTQVLITVDTELSALLHQRGVPADANLASSIMGKAGRATVGIGWQMDCLDRYGLTGVFFVDPMPGMVFGPDIVRRMVEPILTRGHEVQLHIHPEWLEWARISPVGDRRGANIGDFSLADQLILLEWGRTALEQAGAPTPIAFRAGNYGANDDTLKALATLGMLWDASYNGYYRNGPCRIGIDPSQIDPVRRFDVTEIPVSSIVDRPGSVRPAQICALSAKEMRLGLYHAAGTAWPVFSIVTHSFEMLSRDRKRPNHAVMHRFEAMCRAIAIHPGLQTSGFIALDPEIATREPSGAARLGPSRLRTLDRMAQQAVATWLYERRFFPA